MTNGSRAADGAAVMARAVELLEAGESFTMATVVWRQAPSSGQHGSRAIVTAQGELFGWIGGACAEPALTAAASLEASPSRIFECLSRSTRSMQCSERNASHSRSTPTLV